MGSSHDIPMDDDELVDPHFPGEDMDFEAMWDEFQNVHANFYDLVDLVIEFNIAGTSDEEDEEEEEEQEEEEEEDMFQIITDFLHFD